jgi:AcrR family transcriptional regulator
LAATTRAATARGTAKPAVRTRAASTRAARAEQTKQLVLDTAQRLFNQHGYDATSLQMIADEMGVTKAAVYYYFPTKSEILHAVIGVSLARLNTLIDEAATRTGRPARARYVIEGFVDLLISSRHMSTLKNSDPAIERELHSSLEMLALRTRAMQVLFGDAPTPEQRAAYLLVLSVPDIVSSLSDLPDDQLRDALVTVCLRLQRTRS